MANNPTYNKLQAFLSEEVPISALISFRILFGFLMLISVLRFSFNNWIELQFLDPTFFFSWPGLEFFSNTALLYKGALVYPLFIIMALSAIGIMLGFKYRIATILFFISFTWVELIDRTNYLNHYYFVSLVSFLLIFLPANKALALDIVRKPALAIKRIPRWMALIIPLQITVVYFFAGAAKLNSAWLIDAMPMRIWLPAQAHIPIVGSILTRIETAYLFSWSGALYDLTIPFFLLWSTTRIPAFISVIIFHLFTLILFPIGMFPWIMICSALIFFSADWHQSIQNRISNTFKRSYNSYNGKHVFAKYSGTVLQLSFHRPLKAIIGIYFILQILIPIRSHLYPGDIKWHEKGYRFSWRVMLMEKSGHTSFSIADNKENRSTIRSEEYLTPQQEKMMSTQPDMIVQFAHYLSKKAEEQNIACTAVNANSYVSINGKRSQQYLDPVVNLLDIKPNQAYRYLLPKEDRDKKYKIASKSASRRNSESTY